MRGLCGWFSAREGVDGGELLQRMLAAHHGSTPERATRAAGASGLAVFGEIGRPTLIESDGFLVALAGHPRLRSADASGDPLQAVVRALRERGRQALSDIGGDFALATWDSRQRRGLLAIDRIGAHQMVFARTPDGLAFGTVIDLLFGAPGVERRLSPQAIFDYLYYHVCPGPATIFEGVERLNAGHCLEFGTGAPALQQPYWTMRFTEDAGHDTAALKQQFVSLLETTVKEASDGASHGSFLSGGTDSSTVSGMLGRVSGKPARTFSIGFDVPGYDETEYARIAARHFKTDHHEFYVKPTDVVDSLPKIAASYDQPFGNASAIPTYHCARFARENGVTRLLAGDGGDELFGGNERYGKQHLFNLYQRVPGALRRSVVEPLLMSMPGVGAVPPLRKLRSYVEQARPPMPFRYESYNLLQHLGINEVLTPDFIAGVDAARPQKLLVEAHAPFADASLINQMLGIDFRFVLADGDLPKVGHMCNLAGIDVAYPLLDDRMVAFSGTLPADLKLKGTQLRWFFKQALLDFLPPEIITKKKHGFGLPVGHWLIEHKPLRDLAIDSINLLRPRGIVRPEFIRELLERKLHEHPGYYGTMVWLLMMLGLWLESRKL
ncbi:MAG TPA: asparagine synthase-related protein [Albitalea sp.]|uniref:asparagine synthetase B family protein n=1 Tax=Piscinibacter sp. TaxID=1903157 RepID=UPI002ED47D48